MNPQDPRLLKLKEFGAKELWHIHGDLEKHLEGTYDLLKSWGADESLCSAGLYHSIYGTSGFPQQLVELEQRHYIAQIIGQEAEELVYFYAACDRSFTYRQFSSTNKPLYKDRFTGKVFAPTEKKLEIFCELTFANELEIVRHDPHNGRHMIQVLEPLQEYVSANAIMSFREIFRQQLAS